MVDGSKVVQFEENPNKTKQRGLRSGLHADPIQWEIPALFTLQLFLGMKQQ